VVVDNLDILNSCRSPTTADPVLVVDPNRVLTGSIALQFLEPTPWLTYGLNDPRWDGLAHLTMYLNLSIRRHTRPSATRLCCQPRPSL
jgi:hypothetical protein